MKFLIKSTPLHYNTHLISKMATNASNFFQKLLPLKKIYGNVESS